MKLGCHVSIRDGYLNAAKTALALGAQSFQYFPKNPRNMGVKVFDVGDAAACKHFCQEHQLLSIAHTPYPTNLSVTQASLYQRTVESVRNDLEIADACGSIGAVVHFGQYRGADPLRGYQVMITMINEILADWIGSALLLIENNAGQGGRMGTTLEELTQVRSLLAVPDKVGFCLDTCHAFASGLWRGDNWAEVVEQGGRLDYLQHVCSIHLNDSVYESGSFRDRHANIGRGRMGIDALAELLRTPEFADLPVVLETPKPTNGSHRDELQFLRELFSD